MNRLLPAVLLAGSQLLAVSSSWASPVKARVPLVDVSARDTADEEGGLPDGCLLKFVCYAPPSGGDTAEWVDQNKWLYIILRAVGNIGLGITPIVALTLPSLWLPIVFHYTIPEEVRPPIEGDLMIGLLMATLGTLAVAVLTVPLIYLPFGILAYLGINLTLAYWIAPVTLMHLYNAAMKENSDGEATPKKKQKAAKKKKKKKVHRTEDDDEE